MKNSELFRLKREIEERGAREIESLKMKWLNDNNLNKIGETIEAEDFGGKFIPDTVFIGVMGKAYFKEGQVSVRFVGQKVNKSGKLLQGRVAKTIYTEKIF